MLPLRIEIINEEQEAGSAPDQQETEETSCFSNTYTKLQDYFSNQENRQTIFIPSGVEAAVALTCAAITTPFIAKETKWYWQPFAVSGLVLFSNIIVRRSELSSAFKKNRCAITCNDERIITETSFSKSLLRCLRANIFAGYDLIYRGIFTHEGGHALAGFLLFQNCTPQITINPPIGGFTSYPNCTFNQLADKLGDNMTKAILYGSGPGAEMLWDYISLMAAQALPDDYPELKAYLRLSVILSVLSEIMYALADCENHPGYDWCNLNKTEGISPAIAVSFIVISALIVQLLSSGMNYLCNRIKAKNAEPQVEEMNDENYAPNERTMLIQ